MPPCGCYAALTACLTAQHSTGFIRRLDDHIDLVDECLRPITDRIAEELPGIGLKVAVYSQEQRDGKKQ